MLPYSKLNTSLAREGFEAFFRQTINVILRHIGTGTIATLTSNPHRPLSKDELTRRELLAVFLDKASEDELIRRTIASVSPARISSYHRCGP